MFFAEQPIAKASRSRFFTAEKLQGEDFKPNFKIKKSINFDKNGNIELLPGDYIIPVMTYCMKSSGSSPDGHSYILSKMRGVRAEIIRKINAKAIPQFSTNDVQILSWSLQNGLSYEEMLPTSKKIIDKILPESKKELQESFLKNLGKKWDRIAGHSAGIIPSLDELSDDVLDDLGEMGEAIHDIRQFRAKIQETDDFENIRQLIELGKAKTESTPWSKISENIYARFLTNGHFQELGQVQVRVLPSMGRKISSDASARAMVDLLSWIADPKSNSIQPLSFSLLYGATGILLTAELAEEPILAAALLSAILAAKAIDWDSFGEIYDITKDTKNSDVRELIDEGSKTLQKAHDDLEKPAKDLGILDRKTARDTTEKEKNSSRNYVKPGGDIELNKDFDKFPGKVTKPDASKPNIEMKNLPNGSKVIKRPLDGDNLPTLEIQPPKGAVNPKLRIKVRYKFQ